MTLNGLPGGGPWLISKFCEAKRHNTVSAATGKSYPKSDPKCICPHAVDLLAAWRADAPARRQMNNTLRLSERRPEPIASMKGYPDFTGAVCATPRGQIAALGGMSVDPSVRGMNRRDRARALCDTGPCPVRDACRAWVLAQEKPAGSWGGVWGGLDPWNRAGMQFVIKNGRPTLVPFALPS